MPDQQATGSQLPDPTLPFLLDTLRDEIRRSDENIKAINLKIDRLMGDLFPELKADIAGLQVRSGIWGAVAGGFTAIIPLLVALGLALVHSR